MLGVESTDRSQHKEILLSIYQEKLQWAQGSVLFSIFFPPRSVSHGLTLEGFPLPSKESSCLHEKEWFGLGIWEPHRASNVSTCLFQLWGGNSVRILRNLAKPIPGLLGWDGSGAMGRAGAWKANKSRNSACLAALCRDVTVPAGTYPSHTYLERFLSPSEHFLD